MPAHQSFMHLPTEVRLIVYELYVSDHRRIYQRRQPTNAHYKLLRVCRQIRTEAAHIVHSYVSLSTEQQIRSFISSAPDHLASSVLAADVANDGRLVRWSDDHNTPAVPLSRLHHALQMFVSLRHLRVFECRQGFPLQLDAVNARLVMLNFENAMFPFGSSLQLESYELYLSSNTRATALSKLSTARLTHLRLSGNCDFPPDLDVPSLAQVIMQGVTGNYFDRHSLDEWCRSEGLHTFVYALEDKIGFEIRDSHLQSLGYGSGRHLRKLVLLGCSRLTSSVLADSLQQMTALEYFAFHLTTVEEQRTNIILALPPSLSVLKISVINAWYALPLISEERAMCDAIESRLRNGECRLRYLAAHFRALLMLTEGRQTRWEALALEAGCQLHLGPWQDLELP